MTEKSERARIAAMNISCLKGLEYSLPMSELQSRAAAAVRRGSYDVASLERYAAEQRAARAARATAPTPTIAEVAAQAAALAERLGVRLPAAPHTQQTQPFEPSAESIPAQMRRTLGLAKLPSGVFNKGNLQVFYPSGGTQ